jgi:peptidoglycan hydrolase CwlO-like protein
MNTQLENLNKQLRISDVIDVLMAQSLQLMEIVNKNQKEVNRLKEELEQLELHIDNSTDSLTS